MSRFRTALLAAATAALALPALAAAQTPPDDHRDHPHGEQRGDRPPPAGAPGGQPGGSDGRDHANRWGPNAPGGQGGYAGRGPDGNPGPHGWQGGDHDHGGPGPHGWQGGDHDHGGPGPHGWQGGDRDHGGPGPHGWQGGDHDHGGPGPHGWQGGDHDHGGPGPHGWQGGDHRAYGVAGGWNGGPDGWRSDRRYDWRDWRAQNRALFHGPRYYAPRGFGYRSFGIGYRLDPFLYDRAYWIADPYAYRLPPADGPYRWVRYYNDVLLVDLRSGYVADVIRDFFW